MICSFGPLLVYEHRRHIVTNLLFNDKYVPFSVFLEFIVVAPLKSVVKIV